MLRTALRLLTIDSEFDFGFSDAITLPTAKRAPVEVARTVSFRFFFTAMVVMVASGIVGLQGPGAGIVIAGAVAVGFVAYAITTPFAEVARWKDDQSRRRASACLAALAADYTDALGFEGRLSGVDGQAGALKFRNAYRMGANARGIAVVGRPGYGFRRPPLVLPWSVVRLVPVQGLPIERKEPNPEPAVRLVVTTHPGVELYVTRATFDRTNVLSHAPPGVARALAEATPMRPAALRTLEAPFSG